MKLKARERKKMATEQFYSVIDSLQEELCLNGYEITTPVWENLLLTDMKNEEWVSSFCSDQYLVSNYGRIKSLPNKEHPDDIILKQYFTRDGYMYIVIDQKKRPIHRLAALSFMVSGKTKQKKQINHKKGYKWHNVLFNLEWSTPGDNQKHALENGLKIPLSGKDNVASISVIQYDLNGKFVKEWESMKMAENELNIDDAPIAKCCKKNINYHQAYGFIWRFKKDVIGLGEKADLPEGSFKVRHKPKFEKRRATTILLKQAV